ncbi:unnamed protein product [Rotaria sp. Silwood1]|nr:unnamed protein product [Rotaria sp. Silwood1]CAF1666380.1 unnamed protein product [Rotaria sp. Silwood1]CAF4050792.1 unnamed protein product [Rotaria sp. Silwood1]CAF5056278.1 unnamed protein product [Rotaria sp. Silwood1]
MASSALTLIQGAQHRAFIYQVSIIYIILMIVISIVNLIIGAVFYGQCANEPNIPIFLIVKGITICVLFSLNLIMVSSTFLNNTAIVFE